MKKLIVLLLIILSSCSVLCADNTQAVYPYPHYMLGHVNYATYFTSRILEEVLPFDFDNPEAYDANYYDSAVKGIRVGTYTLASNNTNFVLTVSHDKLTRIQSTPDNPSMVTSIDYILYVVNGTTDDSYSSCKSNSQVEVLSGRNLGVGDTIILRDKSFYVFIDDDLKGSTASTVAALQPGVYESYIYFELTGE